MALLFIGPTACNGKEPPTVTNPTTDGGANAVFPGGEIKFLTYRDEDRANVSAGYSYARLTFNLRNYREGSQVEKDLKNTFANIFSRFLTPEKRNFTLLLKVAVPDPNDAANMITISRPIVSSEYDENESTKFNTRFHLGAGDLTPLFRVNTDMKFTWTFEIRATKERTVKILDKAAELASAVVGFTSGGGAWVVTKLANEALRGRIKNIDDTIGGLLSTDVEAATTLELKTINDPDKREGATLVLKPDPAHPAANLDVVVAFRQSVLVDPPPLDNGFPNHKGAVGVPDPNAILDGKYGLLPSQTFRNYFSSGDVGSLVNTWTQLPADDLFLSSCNQLVGHLHASDKLNLNQYDWPAVFWALISLHHPIYVRNQSYRRTGCVSEFAQAAWGKMGLKLKDPIDLPTQERKLEFAEMTKVLSKKIILGLKNHDRSETAIGLMEPAFVAEKKILINDEELGIALGFKAAASLDIEPAILRMLQLKVSHAGCFTANADENALLVSMLIKTGEPKIRRLDTFFANNVDVGTPPPVTGFKISSAPGDYVTAIGAGRENKPCGKDADWEPWKEMQQ